VTSSERPGIGVLETGFAVPSFVAGRFWGLEFAMRMLLGEIDAAGDGWKFHDTEFGPGVDELSERRAVRHDNDRANPIKWLTASRKFSLARVVQSCTRWNDGAI